jgi:glucosamine--fructose-6-phosphate aminotransferase (isomerizing)
MGTGGTLTHQEILSQPEVWEKVLLSLEDQANALRSFLKAGRYDAVVFTGCGSAYYLSLAAAAVLHGLVGVPSLGLPASEVWLYPHVLSSAARRTLLVAISRSGETTETVRACETFHNHGQGDILTLTCSSGTRLSQLGKINLVFPAAQEGSVVETRAFSSLYLASLAIAVLWSGRDDLWASLMRLPHLGHQVLEACSPVVRRLGGESSFDRFYFLGSGLRYGLACELSLKMKEMSLSHSEPFHFLEFRHGPRAMVTTSTLAIGLASTQHYAHEHAVLSEVTAQGGRVLEVGERGEDIPFDSALDEVLSSILFLPVGQLLAFSRATSKGLNPDLPKGLSSVVRLP